ncbi:MAG TPA: VCBS repeat-containing protein [bacterium]|nr:VCBS repeat-containing protein [bacterium]
MFIYFGISPGVFMTAPVTLGTSSAPGEVATFDFDNDGDEDIVVSDYASGHLMFYTNQMVE